jgi:hypothetical protein
MQKKSNKNKNSNKNFEIFFKNFEKKFQFLKKLFRNFVGVEEKVNRSKLL